MMSGQLIVLFLIMINVVLCKPLENEPREGSGHSLWKRFINPSLSFGGFADAGVTKMRTKRGAEECEKLQLCKLHARSQRNFISAFQLYFVNKENARLWDHQARSAAECNQRYSDCYDYKR